MILYYVTLSHIMLYYIINIHARAAEARRGQSRDADAAVAEPGLARASNMIADSFFNAEIDNQRA